MMTLRLAFYLLLLANLACLGVLAMPWLGMEAPFMGSREPERMSNQLMPEKLQLLSVRVDPPLVQPVEPAPVASSEPVEAPVVLAPEPVAAASLPASSPESQCLALAHLTDAQAQGLAQRARGLEGLSVREELAVPSSYWVNIPPLDGRAGAERRAAELRELGLEDFFIVQEAGESRFAISLGLFKAQALAQRQLETLQKRGVKGATVTARQNPSGARVELSGPSELIERLAREAAPAIKGVEREACRAAG